MPEITLVNTSPLFYFHRLGLFELFNKLYGPITVPEAVKKELKEGQSQGEDVPKLEIYPWIKIRIAPVFALGKKLTCAPPFFSKHRKSCLRSVLNITLLIYISITMIRLKRAQRWMH